MKYLLDCLEDLDARIGDRHVVLLLDFDGTLAPIVPTPAEASLPDETRLVLERLSTEPAFTVAIVSGRALGDITGRVGIPGIIYVGNHGLEISRPGGGALVFAVPQFSRLVRQMGEELTAALAGFEGVAVEDKGCSLAVHYRLVGRRNRRRVRAVVHKAARAHGGAREIETRTGKMVVELRPPIGLDKGTIVSVLIEGEKRRWGDDGIFALYVGDDVLDEGAFEAITTCGLGVHVGPPGISCADYRLDDPGDVCTLLKALSERFAEAR